MDRIDCYCATLRRAAQALTSVYDEALAPHGLKVTQFSLLHAVARRCRPAATTASGGPAGPNLTGLAEATGLDRSTLGRNLRLLEGLGFVALSPGEDQRDRRVMLTQGGRARLEEATRTWSRLQATLGGQLGADAEPLLALSRRVTALARAPEAA